MEAETKSVHHVQVGQVHAIHFAGGIQNGLAEFLRAHVVVDPVGGEAHADAVRRENRGHRCDHLAQQAELEQQQQELNQGLTVLSKRIKAVNKRLPPPLQETWRNEQGALGEQPTPSLRLQVSLAQLSSLADFDQRISVHQMPILKEDAGEILVKQFYLGLGMAWFVSADGQFSGWGQADEEGWNWQVSENINAKEISKAIAIFEKRQQAEFVRLPVMLANTSGTLPNEALLDKSSLTNRGEEK